MLAAAREFVFVFNQYITKTKYKFKANYMYILLVDIKIYILMFKVWRNAQISTCCHHFCTTKCHFQSDHLPWPVSLRLHDPLKSEIKIWSCQNLDLNAKGWCHLDYSLTKNDVINQVVSHNVLWNHLELSHNFVVILYKLDAGNLSGSLSPSLGPRNPPPSPGQLGNLLGNLSEPRKPPPC